MNDTIHSRQKKILDLLKQEGVLSRSRIHEKLMPHGAPSRATVIRDLDDLIAKSFVELVGGGPVFCVSSAGDTSIARLY